jgi:Resolvase, N terminal domain
VGREDGVVRVIGYLQVRAVGAVVEGAGFGEQEQQVRRWAHRHGHEVVRTVVDRCSAGPPSPGLLSAVRAVRAGEADAVVVTSRSRAGTDQELGVSILAVDQPRPAAALGRVGTGRRRPTVASTVAIWVAVAAAALVGHRVASAAADDRPPVEWQAGCVSARFDFVPCEDDEMARVLSVTDTPVRCGVNDWGYPRPDGTWLCLRHP